MRGGPSWVSPHIGGPGFGSSRSWVTRTLMRLIRFDEVVEGFGGICWLPSGDVPVGDLGGPAGDGTSELVDLGWAGFVLEVVCELEGVLESEGRTVDLVDASSRFLSRARLCGLRRGGHRRRGVRAAGFDRGR